MRTESAFPPTGIDHVEQRSYHHKLEGALLVAATHRLVEARGRLAGLNGPRELVQPLEQRVDDVIGRLAAAQKVTSRYFESGRFSEATASAIHETALDVADLAEKLLRRLPTNLDLAHASELIRSDIDGLTQQIQACLDAIPD